jgi:hypothetical protein
VQRREVRRWAQLCPAGVIAAAVLGSFPVQAQERPANARLRQPAERMAVAQALRGAALRLTRAECQGLLDEFTDTSGQPLRAALEAQAMDVEEYLGRVLFYDAPEVACQDQMLAGATAAGSRVIRVCGRRFARTVTESSSHAEAIVIHEMFHSLGLGENPPTSDHITTRVRERCRN